MDPFTALGAASGVVGIVSFGLKLATTLQTYVEGTIEADERIRAITNDISATSSALQQLEAVIEHDRNSPDSKLFSGAGLKGVTDTAYQCDAVFKKVIRLLKDSGTPGSQLSNPQTAEGLSLTHIDRFKWPWLEPKILRCRQELERLLLKLLLMLQIVNLARHQKVASDGRPEEFGSEQQLRQIIVKLDHREKLAAQKLAEVVDNATELGNNDKAIDLPSLMPRVVDNEMDAASGSDGIAQRNTFADSTKGPKIVARQVSDIVPPISGQVHPVTPYRSLDEDGRLRQRHLPPENNPSPTPSTTPHMIVTIDGAHDAALLPIEAFLFKGRKNVLKVPLEQGELWRQLQSVLSTPSRSAWDDLLDLTADHHADVCELLKTLEQDGQERILAAIQVREKGHGVTESIKRKLRGKNILPSAIVFLRVVPAYLRAPTLSPLPKDDHMPIPEILFYDDQGGSASPRLRHRTRLGESIEDDERLTPKAVVRAAARVTTGQGPDKIPILDHSSRSNHRVEWGSAPASQGIEGPRDIMRERAAREALVSLRAEEEARALEETRGRSGERRALPAAGDAGQQRGSGEGRQRTSGGTTGQRISDNSQRSDGRSGDRAASGTQAAQNQTLQGVGRGESAVGGVESAPSSRPRPTQSQQQPRFISPEYPGEGVQASPYTATGWEALPGHHYPTRLDDVLENYKSEMSHPSLIHGSLDVGKYGEIVDDLLSKWTTAFESESAGGDQENEKVQN